MPHALLISRARNQSALLCLAAEPMHEVITPWQKQLQQMMKEQRQIFWWTRLVVMPGERFDIYYPSYGDSYPVFIVAPSVWRVSMASVLVFLLPHKKLLPDDVERQNRPSLHNWYGQLLKPFSVNSNQNGWRSSGKSISKRMVHRKCLTNICLLKGDNNRDKLETNYAVDGNSRDQTAWSVK